MEISPRIKAALARGEAVVGVESSLLTHGLSYPKSLELVRDIEQNIRGQGAEPAVFAMLEGKLRIGLEPEEQEWLARAKGTIKLTLADLGSAAAKLCSGGTTAATTAWMAHRAGIRVALAGGLGGVHRDVGETWDISGDLSAMGHYPVLMFCGGIKTFLDIGKSLEALETLGVPVWTYRSDRFPGYFTPRSAFAKLRVDSATEAAVMASAHWKLGLETGIVLGVPIPEESAFDAEEIESVVSAALQEAKGKAGGKGVTPYIIRAIEEHTKGRSAEANRALLVEAARAAAETAVALSKL
ncbi:pseudouridine-5'-phosphate glycosidase [Paenibacillus caui]|uniref:pseudouridine-5'-phosphate glycosidase n=1 Tax=Paenibacillus caui TaxID=2873927 RepID=UPI001CA804AA|nr:pseudouridine-5'-phosphate glycosidase [Paenibacillus caui]